MIGVGECRLEQLPDHPERKATLKIAAARRERSQAGVQGALAQLPQQPTLTDSGGPLD